MTQYFLGVDAGGTKTHALVINDCGEAVGFGRGGPGNCRKVEWRAAAATGQANTRAASIPFMPGKPTSISATCG